MSPLPERRTVAMAGRRLTWREAGSGPALILVHGIGGHSGSWANQLADFAPSHRVIAWDAPGYGGSDPLPTTSPRATDYATALADLLRALNVTSAHLVGHSLGSIMIAELCRAGRFRPDGLVFLQPVTGTGTLPAPERETIRQARIADMKSLGPREFALQRGRLILSKATPQPAVDEAMAVMTAVPEAGYLAAWDMMCAEDLFALLDPKHRTSIVCGSDDPVSPPKTGEAIAARIPGAQFHCLDGVGHYASIEAPDRLNEILRAFVAARA
jgi:pimeloyl-ACP methyl ester carboxylesterase